jgi:hypothetical protein
MNTVRDLAVNQLLGEAAGLLRNHEWGKGDGVLCLMSALSEATYLGNFGVEVYWDATTRCGFANPGEGIKWNDAPERTLDEVIDRINNAITEDVTALTRRRKREKKYAGSSQVRSSRLTRHQEGSTSLTR